MVISLSSCCTQKLNVLFLFQQNHWKGIRSLYMVMKQLCLCFLNYFLLLSVAKNAIITRWSLGPECLVICESFLFPFSIYDQKTKTEKVKVEFSFIRFWIGYRKPLKRCFPYLLFVSEILRSTESEERKTFVTRVIQLGRCLN